MAKYIAIFSETLNDIEITGFITMTDKEMEKYEELAESITWSFVYQLGEEEINYESGEDLLSRIDFKEISNEEYKALKKIFNNDFGTFITEDYLQDIVGDEEEEEEEEDDSDDGYGRNDDNDDDY